MTVSPQKIVLMYHGVIKLPSDRPSDREDGADLYDVPIEDFREQMRRLMLLSSGLVREDVGFPDETPLPMLTFDDGEMNNFHNVLPLLREFGFRGYFFITTGRIGRPGYMDFPQIQIMSDSGMAIGSHGVTHRPLTTLSQAELDHELRASKDLLEQITHRPVTSFSAPGGFFDHRVLAVAKAVGYREIFVSGPAPRRMPQVIGRTAVKAEWDMARFELAIRGETPLKEKRQELFKKILRGMLGTQGYRFVRRAILKSRGKGRS